MPKNQAPVSAGKFFTTILYVTSETAIFEALNTL